jgi:GntR family transcriptional regulator, transcriptional repressor for pyruvate dehydrogenase complex
MASDVASDRANDPSSADSAAAGGAVTGSNKGHRIMAELRQAIFSGDFKAGERLPAERDLSQLFDTNRNTLREAIRELAAMNLVTVRRGDGVLVNDFVNTGDLRLLPHFLRVMAGTPSFHRLLADTLRMRRVIVAETASMAAEDARSNDVHKLSMAVLDIHRAAKANDVDKLIRADFDFWKALSDASNSIVARWAFNTFSQLFASALKAMPVLWLTGDDYLDTLDQMVEAISRGDHKAAADAAVRHFSVTDHNILAILRDSPEVTQALVELSRDLNPAMLHLHSATGIGRAVRETARDPGRELPREKDPAK